MNKILITFFVFLFSNINWIFSQHKYEQQLIDSIATVKNPIKKFGYKLELGRLYQKTNIVKADSILNRLMIMGQFLDESSKLKTLIYKAEIELIKGDREAYFSTVLASQSFFNRINNDSLLIEIFYHLGNYHALNKEYETADFYLKKMLKTSKLIHSKSCIAKSHLMLAKNFTYNKLKDSALLHIDLAIQNARRTSDKSLLADCFHNQASIYKMFDQLEFGVAKDILALQIATGINHLRQMAIFSIEIGKSQYSIHNIDEANYYFSQALDFALKINDYKQQGIAMVELSNISFSRKNYQEALLNCNKAVEIFEKLNYSEGLGIANNSLGMIYKQKEEYLKSSSHFNKALIYFETIGDMKQIAKVYHNVGIVFYAQNKYSNALHYLNKSFEISKIHSFAAQRYQTCRVMSQVYRQLGYSQKALDYMNMYLNYIDSSATEQAMGKIAELNELYRAEQRDRLILSQADSLERQRQEKELTSAQLENVQLKNKFQMYVILGFVLIIVLSVVIMYNQWNQVKIKQQIHEAEMSQKLLRAQMNPHFVFNAMSVIQSYIYENDTQNSSKFLVNFSRLMRLILENSSKEEIPIGLEEEILIKYLETQKLRFEDRFEYEIFIDDELRNDVALIPPMITQPFIENSIEHGQLHTIDGGFIHIYFQKNKDMLEVIIADNGIGRDKAQKNKKSSEHKSMAMNITSERINHLNKKYKTEGFISINDFDNVLHSGTKVLISLPYRTESQTL